MAARAPSFAPESSAASIRDSSGSCAPFVHWTTFAASSADPAAPGPPEGLGRRHIRHIRHESDFLPHPHNRTRENRCDRWNSLAARPWLPASLRLVGCNHTHHQLGVTGLQTLAHSRLATVGQHAGQAMVRRSSRQRGLSLGLCRQRRLWAARWISRVWRF